MNELFLLKLGEIILKGANKRVFEDRLRTNVARRMRKYGDFDVYLSQSTIYVRPLNDECDIEGAWDACGTLFGIITVCRCRGCEKDVNTIYQNVVSYLGDEISAAGSFKVESRRADKRFPLTSIQLSQTIGGMLSEEFQNVPVDVHNPGFTVFIEIRENAAYIHGPSVPGAGGLPTGTGGRGAVLLSGGIDSPVAAFMMAKRGVELECVHFFSYPYTSELAKDKVLQLARLLTRYNTKMTVNIVGFTEIQEAIRDKCPEEYFTIIMRRFMMEISERIALNHGDQCLITGENLGQVASQTMEAMTVTHEVVKSIPVFHPLIGFDKEEIVRIARRIGTMDTSVLPYEDCCTVFTPKHPKTKPSLKEILEAEKTLDREALINRALQNTELIRVKYYE